MKVTHSCGGGLDVHAKTVVVYFDRYNTEVPRQRLIRRLESAVLKSPQRRFPRWPS